MLGTMALSAPFSVPTSDKYDESTPLVLALVLVMSCYSLCPTPLSSRAWRYLDVHIDEVYPDDSESRKNGVQATVPARSTAGTDRSLNTDNEDWEWSVNQSFAFCHPDVWLEQWTTECTVSAVSSDHADS